VFQISLVTDSVSQSDAQCSMPRKRNAGSFKTGEDLWSFHASLVETDYRLQVESSWQRWRVTTTWMSEKSKDGEGKANEMHVDGGNLSISRVEGRQWSSAQTRATRLPRKLPLNCPNTGILI